MDYENLIMDVLEENGLDKRFRDNPEAIRQICSSIKTNIEHRIGKSFNDGIGSDEIQEATRKLLSDFDHSQRNGIAYEDFFSIDKDGSLSVKHKTDVKKSGTSVSRDDSKQIFSIGKENDDFIVTTNRDSIHSDNQITGANTGINFRVFNRHGLETQSRDISQSVTIYSSQGIETCGNAFGAVGKPGIKYELSPVYETICSRNPDLVTENCFTAEKDKNCALLQFNKEDMISKNKDSTHDGFFLLCDSLGPQLYTGKQGTIPNFSPEYSPNELVGYTAKEAEAYDECSDDKRKEIIERAYSDSISRSESFRDTLSDLAKTDPALHEIADKFSIPVSDKSIGIEDFSKVYSEVSSQDISSVLKGIESISRTNEDKINEIKTDPDGHEDV